MDKGSHNALQGCVASLRSSMHLLDSSIAILDSGVNDFPRLAKVLQTTRHFELVSEHDLTTAQASLLDELQPEVATLLSRVETYLDRLERREHSLIAKAELQQGRLSSRGPPAARAGGLERSRMESTNTTVSGPNHAVEDMKVQQLRLKKERLSYAVSRLELQAGQRERQLRKSMAAQ